MAQPRTVVVTPEVLSKPVPPELRSRPRNEAGLELFKLFVNKNSHDPRHIRNAWEYAHTVVDTITDLATRDWSREPHQTAFDGIPALGSGNRVWLSETGKLSWHCSDLLVYHLRHFLPLVRDTVISPTRPMGALPGLMGPMTEGFLSCADHGRRYVGAEADDQVAFRARMVDNPGLWNLKMVEEPGVYGDLIAGCWHLAYAIERLGMVEEYLVPEGDRMTRFARTMLKRAEDGERAQREGKQQQQQQQRKEGEKEVQVPGECGSRPGAGDTAVLQPLGPSAVSDGALGETGVSVPETDAVAIAAEAGTETGTETGTGDDDTDGEDEFSDFVPVRADTGPAPDHAYSSSHQRGGRWFGLW